MSDQFVLRYTSGPDKGRFVSRAGQPTPILERAARYSRQYAALEEIYGVEACPVKWILVLDGEPHPASEPEGDLL